MPKVGMEPVRKRALIEATIAVIGEVGSLDVTVAQIARRAGMSPALAHHYFGSKDQMFLESMRYVLRAYGEAVRRNLAGITDPSERLRAITASSFEPSQFEREVIGAWLNFYLRALQSSEARRLLNIYARRLRSNLMFDLRKLFDTPTAETIAQGMAALIDGLYIRAALQPDMPGNSAIQHLVNDYLDLWLERTRRG